MKADAPTLSIDVSVQLGALRLDVKMESASRTLALVGPSGAGKSTVLRIVAGLLKAATGRVAAGGEIYQDSSRDIFVPPWKRGTGWVPQDGILFPHRTVVENLAWSGSDSETVTGISRLLEIEGLLGRHPRHLSGGEKQRVALGRALLANPRLLLLDEPFAAVDRPLRQRLAASLAGWCRERNLTVLLVSHDEGDVSLLAGEIWQLQGGHVILAAADKV